MSWVNALMAVFILIFCFLYIYRRFKTQDVALPSIDYIQNIVYTKRGVLLLLTVMALAVLNWFVEAVKWRYLLSNIFALSIKKAYVGVLMGLSITMIIPYRVGSFIGRVWNVAPEHRLKGILASVFGGLAQLFVTVIIGLLALALSEYNLHDLSQNYITSISAALLLLISFTYFFPSYIVNVIKKIPSLSQASQSFAVLENYDLRKKLTVVLYSLLRYTIFILQFYFVLSVFDAQVVLLEIIFPISIVFLILSIAPTIVFGLGVREFSALLLLSPMYASAPAVLMSSVIIWLVNMIFPALVGALFFIKSRKRDG